MTCTGLGNVWLTRWVLARLLDGNGRLMTCAESTCSAKTENYHVDRWGRERARESVCVCVCGCGCVWVLCVTMKGSARRMASETFDIGKLQVSSCKHNAKKNTTRVRGPFHQSITNILTKKEKQFTKPTHVAVYLFRDLDQDRSRL